MARKNIIMTVERVGEATGGDRGRNSERTTTGEKSSGFAVEMHFRKPNYLINCVCVYILFERCTEIIKLNK